MHRIWLPCVVVLLAVVAASCSSGGKTASSSSSSTSMTAAPTSAPSAAPATTVASTCAPTSSASGAAGKGDAAPPGDIPDNQAFVAFASPTGHYTVKVPEGWARADEGQVTTFSDKLNSVRIETVPTPAAPSAATVQGQDVPAVRAQSRCFEGGTVTTAARKSGAAILLTYRADSAPDPVTGKVVHDDVERYAFWRGGTEAIVTLSSPQGSDNVDPWRTVTDSFAWS